MQVEEDSNINSQEEHNSEPSEESDVESQEEHNSESSEESGVESQEEPQSPPSATPATNTLAPATATGRRVLSHVEIPRM